MWMPCGKTSVNTLRRISENRGIGTMPVIRSTFGVDRDLFLLPHFIKHYRSLGVTEFRLILHAGSAESPNLTIARDLLASDGITAADIWITENWNTGENANRHRRAVSDLPDSTWVLTADSDEFHIYPQPLLQFIKGLEESDISVVTGRLVDFVSADWRLHPPRDAVSLFEQCSTVAEPVFRFPGNPGKVMLHRAGVHTTPGHHSYEDCPNKPWGVYPEVLTVAHFKWFASVSEKYTDPSKIAHHSNSWEYQIYSRQINRNFYGFGRLANRVLHTSGGRFFRSAFRTAKGGIKSLLKSVSSR